MGLFSGAIIRKDGLRILGSHAARWTSGYMGFAVGSKVRAVSSDPLREFAFRQLGCVHVELRTEALAKSDVPDSWQQRSLHGYELDLSQSEDALFNAMNQPVGAAFARPKRAG